MRDDVADRFPTPEMIMVDRRDYVDQCLTWLLDHVRRLMTLPTSRDLDLLNPETGLDITFDNIQLQPPPQGNFSQWAVTAAMPRFKEALRAAGWVTENSVRFGNTFRVEWVTRGGGFGDYHITGRVRPADGRFCGPYR